MRYRAVKVNRANLNFRKGITVADHRIGACFSSALMARKDVMIKEEFCTSLKISVKRNLLALRDSNAAYDLF